MNKIIKNMIAEIDEFMGDEFSAQSIYNEIIKPAMADIKEIETENLQNEIFELKRRLKIEKEKTNRSHQAQG